MLRRLRLKFVALNMATVAVVLAVVFTAICVINYQQSTNGVYSALDAAIDHAGDAAKMPPVDGILGPQGATGGSAFSGMTPPEIGGRRAEGESVIPVVVYALEDDGGMAVVPSSTTASIADDVLSDAASAVLQKGEGSGFLDAFGLFYSKRAVGGTTFVAFADASAVSSWQSLALTLAAVGVGALAVFLVISVFFSRWALGPVARRGTSNSGSSRMRLTSSRPRSRSSWPTRPSCARIPNAAWPAKASGSKARRARRSACRSWCETCWTWQGPNMRKRSASTRGWT